MTTWNLAESITNALNCMSGTQDRVRQAHGAAQTGSIGLASIRQELARRLGKVVIEIEPLKAELASLIVAARILDGLEREEQVRLEDAQHQNRRPGKKGVA